MTKRTGKPRDVEREEATGVAWYMLDDDGFVLERFRNHVAALRKPPQMCNIGEVIHAATARGRNAED